MRIANVKQIAAILFALIIMVSCEHEPIMVETYIGIEDTLNTDTIENPPVNEPEWTTPPSTICDTSDVHVYFYPTVFKLIVRRCAPIGIENSKGSNDCHAGAFKDSRDADFTTYIGIYEYVKDFKKSDSSGSDLWDRINSDTGNVMPEQQAFNKLTSVEIKTIGDWIVQGAKNDSCYDCMDFGTTADFREDVVPFLFENCSGCHNNKVKGPRLKFFTSFPTENDYMQTNIDDNIGVIIARMGLTPNDNERVMPKILPRIYKCENEMMLNYYDQKK